MSGPITYCSATKNSAYIYFDRNQSSAKELEEKIEEQGILVPEFNEASVLEDGRIQFDSGRGHTLTIQADGSYEHYKSCTIFVDTTVETTTLDPYTGASETIYSHETVSERVCGFGEFSGTVSSGQLDSGKVEAIRTIIMQAATMCELLHSENGCTVNNNKM